MKILMFGRGVISTLYGWALEKAGNEVDFYVRPGRAADFGSSVDVDIRDGRASSKGKPVQENWPITLREDLEPDHDYDLIIVSVNHDQLDSAVDFLQPRVGGATILIFNNVWADPAAAISRLPREQVAWGFPGGGGGFDVTTLHGGFAKSIFLGDIEGRAAPTGTASSVNSSRRPDSQSPTSQISAAGSGSTSSSTPESWSDGSGWEASTHSSARALH